MDKETQKRQYNLIMRVKKGERQLLPELWEALEPLTNYFIKKYELKEDSRLYDIDDLKQDCFFALLDALEYWNPDGENAAGFATVYRWYISTRTRQTRGQANRSDVLSRGFLSIDKPIKEEGDSLIGDFIEDTAAAEKTAQAVETVYEKHLREAFEEINRQLTPEQREIIRLRYGEQLSIEAAAARLTIKPDRCRRLEQQALSFYRREEIAKQLERFVDSPANPEPEPQLDFSAEISRAESLRGLADKATPARRAQWLREDEYLRERIRWGGLLPKEYASLWSKYIEEGGDCPQY